MPADLPNPAEAALRARALATLRETFGYPEFRGAQADIVAHVAGGGDALVLMPTGGGKSMCYQLPALLRGGTAVVVSPLIALMQDQVDQLGELGIRAAALNSALDAAAQRQLEQRLRRGELQLLYVAPERLLGERTLALLEQIKPSLFAIDEAHCVSQWGHDFRPEYRQLSLLHERFPGVPRIALTATADPATRSEIVEQLRLDDARVFVSSFDRPNLSLAVVPKDRARHQLLDFIADKRGQSGIVYCLSRKSVDETAIFLQGQGIRCLAYHAGMDAATRSANQRRFIEEEGLVMAATVAFGMGIDKPDVRFVAHLDLPKSLEGYYQEIGRAGRDGDPAAAWLCFGLSDLVQLRRFIDESEASEERKRYEYAGLNELLGYCETSECRRVALLRHFGESYPGQCGNCDNCRNPQASWNATEAARKLLSAIFRSGQRFGAQHVIGVLRGVMSEKVESHGHHKLSVWGIGADLDERSWSTLLRQLVTRGLVQVDSSRFNALVLDPSCGPLLRGEVELWLKAPPAATTRKRSKRASADAPASGPELELGAAARHRFDALRAWRTEQAREHGVPPYVIFNDRTLRELATEAPTRIEALRGINGIGAAKLERYGKELLRVIEEA